MVVVIVFMISLMQVLPKTKSFLTRLANCKGERSIWPLGHGGNELDCMTLFSIGFPRGFCNAYLIVPVQQASNAAFFMHAIFVGTIEIHKNEDKAMVS